MFISMAADQTTLNNSRFLAASVNAAASTSERVECFGPGCFANMPASDRRVTFLGHGSLTSYGSIHEGGDGSLSPEAFVAQLVNLGLPAHVQTIDLLGCNIGLKHANGSSYVSEVAERLQRIDQYKHIKIQAFTSGDKSTADLAQFRLMVSSRGGSLSEISLIETPRNIDMHHVAWLESKEKHFSAELGSLQAKISATNATINQLLAKIENDRRQHVDTTKDEKLLTRYQQENIENAKKEENCLQEIASAQQTKQNLYERRIDIGKDFRGALDRFIQSQFVNGKNVWDARNQAVSSAPSVTTTTAGVAQASAASTTVVGSGNSAALTTNSALSPSVPTTTSSTTVVGSSNSAERTSSALSSAIVEEAAIINHNASPITLATHNTASPPNTLSSSVGVEETLASHTSSIGNSDTVIHNTTSSSAVATSGDQRAKRTRTDNNDASSSSSVRAGGTVASHTSSIGNSDTVIHNTTSSSAVATSGDQDEIADQDKRAKRTRTDNNNASSENTTTFSASPAVKGRELAGSSASSASSKKSVFEDQHTAENFTLGHKATATPASIMAINQKKPSFFGKVAAFFGLISKPEPEFSSIELATPPPPPPRYIAPDPKAKTHAATIEAYRQRTNTPDLEDTSSNSAKNTSSSSPQSNGPGRP